VKKKQCPNFPKEYEESTRKLYELSVKAVQQNLKGIADADGTRGLFLGGIL
jgi:hypothetical protein